MFKEQNLCLLHPLMLKVILGVDWSLYSLNSFCFCFLWFLGPMKVSLIIVGVKSHFKVLNLFVQSVLSFLQALTSKSLVPTQQHLEACPQCKILGSVPDLFNQNLHFWQDLCVIWSISTFKFEKFWTRTFWDGRQPLCWPRDEQVVDPSQFPLSWHLGCPPLFKSPSILPLQSLLPSKAELVIQHRAQSIDRGVRNDWACARARARTDTHTHTPPEPRHTDRGHSFFQSVSWHHYALVMEPRLWEVRPSGWAAGCRPLPLVVIDVPVVLFVRRGC